MPRNVTVNLIRFLEQSFPREMIKQHGGKWSLQRQKQVRNAYSPGWLFSAGRLKHNYLCECELTSMKKYDHWSISTNSKR